MLKKYGDGVYSKTYSGNENAKGCVVRFVLHSLRGDFLIEWLLSNELLFNTHVATIKKIPFLK